MSKVTPPPTPEELGDILNKFEVLVLELVGDEFAPKVEGGSPERKRLLALIGRVFPIKQDIEQMLKDREQALLSNHRLKVLDEVAAAGPEDNNHPHRMFSADRVEAFADGFDAANREWRSAIKALVGEES